ncbi:hypothetical protein LCGC14_1133580 [marine sediment metagenome]|uniref:Uncharacterized protein n=1 Tax=marine sediment metagenome TaxID=412755 RepID=A0A0F9M0F1_9ZZZZ
MNSENNIVCFNHVIDFKDNTDPEAWYRILEAFIKAVEKEGASAGGGMHSYGSTKYCCKQPWWDFRYWFIKVTHRCL